MSLPSLASVTTVIYMARRAVMNPIPILNPFKANDRWSNGNSFLCQRNCGISFVTLLIGGLLNTSFDIHAFCESGWPWNYISRQQKLLLLFGAKHKFKRRSMSYSIRKFALSLSPFFVHQSFLVNIFRTVNLYNVEIENEFWEMQEATTCPVYCLYPETYQYHLIETGLTTCHY